MNTENIRIPFSSVYIYGGNSLLYTGKYKPASIIVQNNEKIIIKLLGFIKVKEILVRDIKKIEIIKKKWVGKGLRTVYADYAISITNKFDNRIYYIISQEEKLKPLKEFLLN